MDLFYAFQGKKRPLGHTEVGLLVGFAPLQDWELAQGTVPSALEGRAAVQVWAARQTWY